MTAGRRTVRAVIRGRVQGVGFRDWTESAARRYGLDGWVRNLPDGNVEALFAGPGDVVDRMLADCRRGPPAARVAAVDAEDSADSAAAGFSVRY
jgi:acylphosphatase